IMTNRVAIPIHKEQGELVPYVGRTPGDPPPGASKYLFPPKFKKTHALYNFHRAREHATDGLIVVEGFFTVFEFWERNRKNVVALMGSPMSTGRQGLIVDVVGRKGEG